MKYIRKLRKNAKAISPVIAVLLMIAIAVAASLVTYAWVMGYMGFTTNKVGKAIQIQAVSQAGIVSVQNVGDATVTLEALYLNGALVESDLEITLDVGETTDSLDVDSLDPNTQYVIKVTTTDGVFSELTKIFP